MDTGKSDRTPSFDAEPTLDVSIPTLLGVATDHTTPRKSRRKDPRSSRREKT